MCAYRPDEASDQAPGPGAPSRHRWVAVALILLLGLMIRCYHLDYPFIATQDSGMFPSFARNLAECGLGAAAFLPVSSHFSDGSMSHHIGHPPLAHVSVALMFQALGIHEWVYRLFNIASGLVVGLFLYLLVAWKIGGRAGLWALFFWSFIPSSAYFERMFTMNLQAEAASLAFLYCFLHYAESRSRRWLWPSALFCLLGVLSDWNFNFIFPGLLLLGMVRRRYLRPVIYSGIFCALLLLAFAAYAGLMKRDIQEFTWALKGADYWASYARLKLKPWEILNPAYLARIAWLFRLHFTALGWLVPLAWLWSLWQGRRQGQDLFWPLALPLILFSQALVYLVLVPVNTYGHIWTLYWLSAPLAVGFGLAAAGLSRSPRPALRLAAPALAAALIFLSLPTLARLHRPNPYYTANSRAGQVMARTADRSTYALVDNHDTLAYYAGFSVFDIPGGRRQLPALLDEELESGGRLPRVVALNQDYHRPGAWRLDPPGLEKALRQRGYRPWLRRPVAAWRRQQPTRLYLLMDQYPLPSPGPTATELRERGLYFRDGGRLLRGFYQQMQDGSGRTLFKNLPLPRGHYRFLASVFLVGDLSRLGGAAVDYRVRVGERVVAAGRLGASHPQARVEADLSAWSGRKIELALEWQARGLPARGLPLVWGEPRLVETSFTPRPDFWVRRDMEFFPERTLGGGAHSPSLAEAAYFWWNLLRGRG